MRVSSLRVRPEPWPWRLALLAGLAGLAGLLRSSAASAAPRELGLNVHQSQDVGLDATRASGTRWVRIDLNWLDVERAAGVYDWTVIDAVVNGAQNRGLKVLAVIGYGPAWASQGDLKGGGSLNDVPRAGTYASFVTAAVNRYKSRVTHYELWNEPNLEQFWEGTPQDYVQRILVPGADAVHAACSSCKVLGPGVASVGGQYDVWMDAALQAAASKIDIVSAHAYAAFPQDSSTAGVTSDSFYNKLEKRRVVELGGVKVYEGPASFKEVMDRRGVQKPFWLTETGLEARPGDAAQEAKQALFYRRVLESMLVRPWWEATIFYEAFDEPPAPYIYGVVVRDPAAPGGYREKQAMGVLKRATANQPAFGGNGTDCNDGLDNDNDGKIDFPADPDCKSEKTSSEGTYIPPPAPDAGPGPGLPAPDAGDGEPEADSGIPGPFASENSSEGGCSATPSPLWLGAPGAFAIAAMLTALVSRRRLR